ncbi:MAG: molybdopterin-guanine dinucleotide biosynthesis protein B, partial [Paracoccaceae bacterium]
MRLFGVTGWKNAGKTGLIERLVREITTRGFSVSTLKHAHHAFDVDQPGKDSFRHRIAGAVEVLLSSGKRWALMHENRGVAEPPLADLLAKLEPVDLVLVEGYKRDAHPKVEAHRAAPGNPLIARDDASVVAIASDVDIPDVTVPVFDLDDTAAVADFILTRVGLVAQQPVATPDLTPPHLSDDCFSLPRGVDWVPVDEALAALRDGVAAVVGQEACLLDAALGRVLSADVKAVRSNPPAANSAVDGYGFAHATIAATGDAVLPLADGRAAAGAPFQAAVPAAHAVRILTGALLPDGVDTVVLQEDVLARDAHIAFDASLRAGANTRRAGEDVMAGAVALAGG